MGVIKMLLKPSCLELMKKLNEYSDDENKISSPYPVVIIISKCAREINKNRRNEEENSFIGMKKYNDIKAISEAIKRLSDGKVKVKLNRQ